MRCSLTWRNSTFVGEKHPNWRHGVFSYKETLLRSGIPQVCALCKTTKRSVIIVHHLDKNRKNNNLENLTWLCRNCHFLVHNYEEENGKLLRVLS